QKFNLSDAAIVGLSELTPSQSPGTQWLEGARWKDTLLKRVRELRSAASTIPPEVEQELKQLRAELQAAQKRASDAEAKVKELQGKVKQLQDG
ncbi:MAG: hypothetical protein J7M34_04430, partial [Anaerolineae bacterium]|nr:hypothetical protein [Anaerolineae bacterium]